MAFPLALGLLHCGGPPAAPTSPPAGEPQAAEVLARAIRFRTVNPPGDEAPLAAYLVELLRAARIEARVVPTPAGSSRVGRAAAWGRVPGSGQRAALVLLSHLDVVPADPDRWHHDPFAGVVQDGYVVGRGAQDAKGVAVVQLLTMLALARRAEPLRRDVIFLATPDEELGGRAGAGWIAREHPELLEGATWLLTEGGGVLVGKAGVPIWHVAFTEKSPCWLRLVASGPPGHSSVPPADAAVPRLVAALERVRGMETPIRVVPEVARMFAQLAPRAAAEDAAGFADLGRALAEDAAFRRRFLDQPRYAALVRDTLSITVLEGSPRTNVLAARASAHLDARLLPGRSCSDFADAVRQRVADPGIQVETLLSFEHSRSPVDTPLYRAVAAVAAASQPGALVVPRVVAGFTDAHYFREIGLVAYGFVPRWHRPDEPRGVHGVDERISVENLERGVATLLAILEELDRQDP